MSTAKWQNIAGSEKFFTNYGLLNVIKSLYFFYLTTLYVLGQKFVKIFNCKKKLFWNYLTFRRVITILFKLNDTKRMFQFWQKLPRQITSTFQGTEYRVHSLTKVSDIIPNIAQCSVSKCLFGGENLNFCSNGRLSTLFRSTRKVLNIKYLTIYFPFFRLNIS